MSSTEKNNISFPEDLSKSLSLLQERWFMTSNTLSDYIGSHMMQSQIGQDQFGILPALGKPKRDKAPTKADYQQRTHQIKITEKNGAHTLKATTTHSKKHQVFFGGNNQDVLHPDFVKAMLKANPSQNYIFENYPGVDNDLKIKQINPLFAAGYQQVKTLLTSGVSAEDITLYGLSLGGGVAAQVASRLHAEGYPVNLTIDRSFSSLSAVAPPFLEALLENMPDLKKKYGKLLPLGTSMAALAVTGASLGTALAGLIASIGVLISSLIASIGYYTSLVLSMIPGFTFLANGLNDLFSGLAGCINTCFDVVASTVGGLVGLVGLVSGSIVGAVVGAFLSLQLLVTDKPANMPLEFGLRAFLNTTTGEMDSVGNVQHILSHKKHGQVTIINSKNDMVIQPKASLNTGLGLSDNPNRRTKKQGFGGNVHSIWYNKADHDGPLQDDDIDHGLSHVEPA
ncbi:MAG: hypothetical protein K0U37_00675 [Gammaproteobacteria bacterium]|nr:hypothetical protein [Gammaproteobacteria bacterium]